MPILGLKVRSAQPNIYSKTRGRVIHKRYEVLFSEKERLGAREAKVIYIF